MYKITLLLKILGFPRNGLFGNAIKPYSVSSGHWFKESTENSKETLPKLSLQNSKQNHSPILSSSNLSSPNGSNSSGGSPQCTPLTPYNSFGTLIENNPNIRRDSKNLPKNRGNISLQLHYDAINTTLQVIKKFFPYFKFPLKKIHLCVKF